MTFLQSQQSQDVAEQTVMFQVQVRRLFLSLFYFGLILRVQIDLLKNMHFRLEDHCL